jgi:hypothetical protein
MKCPHCQTAFHDNVQSNSIGKDADGVWFLETRQCPACQRFVIELVMKEPISVPGFGGTVGGDEMLRYLVRPKVANRPLPPPSVPSEVAKDYKEAAAVIVDSPMASAALSRRCLQNVLREKACVKKSDLAKEIDEVLASKSLPSHLAEAIDAIRNIGNFAAHPVKSTSTGQVLPVEPGEADWTLDVLDGLFDFYYVQPARLAQRRTALNAKLVSAGKPPTK